MTEELRQLGNEALHGWARRQAQRKEEAVAQQPGVQRKEKNVYWQTRYGQIEVAEQVFRQGSSGPEIPIVETAEANDQSAKVDRRKTRQMGWKEVRLSLVHTPGSVTPVFGATVGPPDQVGETLLRAAVQAGLGRKTQVHAVSDGAAWIADQVSAQFGLNGHFLVDFYHVCDYLTAAGKTIAGTAARAWVETQKDRLKQNRHEDVVDELQRFVEDDSVPDDNAPVRAAHRYLTAWSHRPGQASAFSLASIDWKPFADRHAHVSEMVEGS